jgi:hypothetical protein
VSINKMKRNIAPALLRNGLNYTIEFTDLKPIRLESSYNGQTSTSNSYTVTCIMTIYDEETGYSETSSAMGGCPATEKGINICQTYALKQLLSNLFMLIDGIEPEDLELKDSSGSFHRKSDEEIEEVKSEILSNKNVVEPKKAEPKKAEPKKAAKKEAPAEKPEEAPTAVTEEEPKKAAIDAVDVDNLPDCPEPEKKAEKYELVGPQKNTIETIVEDWNKAAKEGRTSPEEYNKMSMARATIGSPKEAVDFIRMYRNVKTVG